MSRKVTTLIKKLPPRVRSKYYGSLNFKDASNLSKAFQQLVESTTFDHAQLTDSHLDVHPQYYNTKRLLGTLKPIIQDVKDRIEEEKVSTRKTLKPILEKIVSLSDELDKNVATKADILTQSTKLLELQKAITNLQEAGELTSGLEKQITNLKTQLNGFLRRQDLEGAIDIIVDGKQARKEFSKDKLTFRITSKATQTIIPVGGGGGVDLTSVNNSLTQLGTGLSSVSAGLSTLASQTGTSANFVPESLIIAYAVSL